MIDKAMAIAVLGLLASAQNSRLDFNGEVEGPT